MEVSNKSIRPSFTNKMSELNTMEVKNGSKMYEM
jgi:hypothetical protein